MRLNGWQRIWVVITIALFMGACVSTAMIWKSVWPVDGKQVVYRLSDTQRKAFENAQVDETSASVQMPDGQVMRMPTGAAFLAEFGPAYRNAEFTLKAERVGLFFGGWVAISFLLYVFGWAFAWVRRGFP